MFWRLAALPHLFLVAMSTPEVAHQQSFVEKMAALESGFVKHEEHGHTMFVKKKGPNGQLLPISTQSEGQALHTEQHARSGGPRQAAGVSCGNFKAVDCASCVLGHEHDVGSTFCIGDCSWVNNRCLLARHSSRAVDDTSVSCGNHRAVDCASCPQGHGEGWCHRDCLWLRGECVLATAENMRAAAIENRNFQSRPRLRAGGVRSDPEPGLDDLFSGGVRNLVGSTFEATAKKLEKDVLVNCYAPWCGHSQQFKPKLQALASSLAHVPTLEFAQIDATRNDLGSLGDYVEGYPTLLLFPAGARKDSIIEYHGHRTPEDMTKWLHVHATHTFSDRPPSEDATDPADDSGGLLSAGEEIADL